MGMAASQARLLSLTARLHDVEYKAQNLQAQKLALATQRDELYQDYCAALDATEFKVTFMDDGEKYFVDANFNNLCTYNENRVTDYVLVNNENDKIIVSQDIKDAYDKYGYRDKYAFAWAAMGLADDLTYDTHSGGSMLANLGVGNNVPDWEGILEPFSGYANGNLYMTDAESKVYDKMKSTYPELEQKYNELLESTDKEEQQKLWREFREALYSTCGKELWEAVNINKNNTGNGEVVYNQPDVSWDELEKEFNYYTRIWEAINEAGGCVTIDENNKSGEQGNKWFYNMVNSGSVGIKYLEDRNDKTWDDTSIATSVNKNHLQETEADEKAMRKAEAEYEHGLDLINKKDTKFDTELSKLETERTAITTEMDSIKKVKDENIERTFGIFS